MPAKTLCGNGYVKFSQNIVHLWGWGDDHKIGRKFANEIEKDDVILIARRHRKRPEIIGFGVVTDKFERSRTVPGTHLEFRSMRKLKPSRPLSGPPKNIPIMDALGHTMALAQLHPEWDDRHKRVCEWMASELSLFETNLLAREKNLGHEDPRLRNSSTKTNLNMKYVAKRRSLLLVETKQNC